MRRAVVALALLVPLLATCGDDEGGGENAWEPCETTSSDVGHPAGSSDAIIRMGYGGGLPPPVVMPDELPDLVVYGDGRVLVADQTASYATPAMLEGRLDEPAIQRMLHAVEGTCGLERDWTLDADVYDVGGFWVETTTDAGTHRTLATGLGFDDIAESIPDEQEEQRAALMELDTELRTIAEEAGLVPLVPEELGVFLEPIEGAPEGMAAAPWPLQEDLATLGAPHPEVTTVRCGTVDGDDATAVIAALQPDAGGTVPALEDDGVLFRVSTRPMLPGETDCLALIA
jgi:hypothetical protein